MAAVLATMLVAVIVFLVLMNMRGSNLIGTWTMTGSSAVATPTHVSTGDQVKDLQQFGRDYLGDTITGFACGAFAFPQTMEFRSDGTAIFGSGSALIGSASMSYETIDGSRIRFSAGSGSVVYGYSVNGNTLTLTKDGCPDTYYSR